MKIKIKQTFRSMWATILAVLMLLSTFTAVAVTLNVENSGADTAYYLWYGNNNGTISSWSTNETMTSNGDGTYSVTLSLSKENNLYFYPSTSSSSAVGGDTFPYTNNTALCSSTSTILQYGGTSSCNVSAAGGEIHIPRYYFSTGNRGPFTFTITFDPSNYALSVADGSSTPTTTIPTTTTPSSTKTEYYYCGEMNSWGAAKFTMSDDKTYAYYQTDASKRFKLTKGDNWDWQININNDYVVQTANNNEAADINLSGGDDSGIVNASAGYIVVLYSDNPYYNYTGTGSEKIQVICVSSLDRLNSSSPTTYNVTLATGITGGSISSTSTLTGLTGSKDINLKATPDTGYTFTGWSATSGESNVTFSSQEAETTATVTGACTITATFTQNSTSDAVANGVSLTASPAEVIQNNPVTLTAALDTPNVSAANVKYTFTQTSGPEVSLSPNGTTDATTTFTPSAAGTYKFKVTASCDGYNPVQSSEVTVTVTAPVDVKGDAFSEGMWIDAQPDENTADAMVKPYFGTSGKVKFYLPGSVDLENVHFYHKYNSLTVGSTPITSGNTYNISSWNGQTITYDGTSKTLVIFKSTAKSLYINDTYTTASDGTKTYKDMPTSKVTDGTSASNFKKQCNFSGTYVALTTDGKTINSDKKLKSIKGRGNSSWKASCELFGKYAYNISLGETADLAPGGTPSKKWSMLANNADEAMMRNILVYNLADAIGLDDSPMSEVYDVYNNGTYLGSYQMAEKVEVAKSGALVQGENVDKLNEAANTTTNLDGTKTVSAAYNTDTQTASNDNLQDNSTKGYYKYCAFDTGFVEPTNYKSGNYLLEFELDERFPDEVSGFISNYGQQVVLKSPEFASRNEVLYAMDRFNFAEAVIYAIADNKSNGTYNDLAAGTLTISDTGYSYKGTASGNTYTASSLDQLINVENFAKAYLIQEFTENLDGVATSFYVDITGENAPLVSKPVWDFDWTMGQYSKEKDIGGNQPKRDPSLTNQWFIKDKYIYSKTNSNGTNKNIMATLCSIESFWAKVKDVWNGTSSTSLLSTGSSNLFPVSALMGKKASFNPIGAATGNSVYTEIRSLYGPSGKIQTTYKTALESSVAMNEDRYGFIATDSGISGWGSKETGSTWKEAVDYLDTWANKRATWMNAQFTGTSTDEYYIGGRFDTGTDHTGNNVGDWDITSKNIQFEYDSEKALYYVTTNKTIADLSGKNYYFVVHNGSDKAYVPGSDALTFQNNIETNKLQLVDGTYNNGRTAKMMFDNTSSTSTAKVTLWFDATNKQIWYTTDAVGAYTITKADTTNGSFTVSQTTANQGDSITITASPNSGFTVDTVTVTGASGTVDVNGTGNTRTFTMPAYNVTITVRFKAAPSDKGTLLDGYKVLYSTTSSPNELKNVLSNSKVYLKDGVYTAYISGEDLDKLKEKPENVYICISSDSSFKNMLLKSSDGNTKSTTTSDTMDYFSLCQPQDYGYNDGSYTNYLYNLIKFSPTHKDSIKQLTVACDISNIKYTINAYDVISDAKPLADGVRLTADPETQTIGRYVTLTATLDNVNVKIPQEAEFTYTFYCGSDVVDTKKVTNAQSPVVATCTVTSNTESTQSYTVTVSTSTSYITDTYIPTDYASVTSNAVSVTYSDVVYYYAAVDPNSGNVNTREAIPGNNMVSTTVSDGGTYYFSVFDNNTDVSADSVVDFTVDIANNRYCTITKSSTETGLDYFIVKCNAKCSKPVIYFNKANKTVYAVATQNVGSTNTLDINDKTVTYYFAEEKTSSTALSDPSGTTNGMRIKYWNNSVDNSETIDVTTPVGSNGKETTALSGNRIFVNLDKFAGMPSGITTKLTEFYIYSVKLPIWATSFNFVTSDGTDLVVNNTSNIGKNNCSSIVLNPNRIYCLFEQSNTNYVRGVVLDESMWSSETRGETNEVATQGFASNIVNYKTVTSKDPGNVDFNTALTAKYGTDYEHPLYFNGWYGTDDESNNTLKSIYGTTHFKLHDNLAMRKTEPDSFYASIQNLTDNRLSTTKKNKMGNGYLLGYNGSLMPLFDYDMLNENKTTLVNNGQLYENVQFPFYASTFDGVTTYSYDSTTDRNRVVDTEDGVTVKVSEDFVNKGSSYGYFPFGGTNDYDTFGCGTEFDINFYMTNNGKLSNGDDIAFNFSGDDDVWVYVDGVRVLDLGGAHSVSSGTINFSDMKVYYKTAANATDNVSSCKESWSVETEYVKTVSLKDLFEANGATFSNTDASTQHTLQMFYLERGQGESNCSISFNLPQNTGFRVNSNVTTNNVNEALVQDTMASANKDYFNYQIANKIATETEYNTAKTKFTNAHARVTGVSGLTPSTNPSYPIKSILISRDFLGTKYYLTAKSEGISPVDSENTWLDSVNSSTFTTLKNVNYTLSDAYAVKGASTEETSPSGRVFGSESNSGIFNLLFGQSALFESKIPNNTMIQLSQDDKISKVNAGDGDTTVITAGEDSTKTVSDYYSSSYSIIDDNTGLELANETQTVTDGKLYANDASDNSNMFYFANYSGDATASSNAMTVTYTNDVLTSKIKLAKSVQNPSATDNFYFKVEFSRIFGEDLATAKEYTNLQYKVFNASDKELVATRTYGKAGVYFTANQYAIIEGVPVDSAYKVVEKDRAGYKFVNASKTTYNDTTEVETVSDLKNSVEGKTVSGANGTTTYDAITFTNTKQAFTVNFKYYDRSVVSGTTSHISTSPTTVTYSFDSISEFTTEDNNVTTYNLEGIILKAYLEYNFDNLIDTYTSFTSQTNAIKDAGNFKVIREGIPGVTPGETTYSTAYPGVELGLHYDCYGRPQGTDGCKVNDGEEWVTYYSGKTKLTESKAKEGNSNVDSITVWLYNTLKKYKPTFYYAPASASDADLEAVTGTTDRYVATTNKSYTISDNVYYNVRLGNANGNTQNDAATDYLKEYGITEGYCKEIADISSSVTYNGNNLKFLYWASDPKGKTILSTDIAYGYRVTNNLKAYAVYGKTDLSDKGLTIIPNTPDYYSNSTGKAFLRLNNVMNVYNCPERDKNIKNASIIYIIDYSKADTNGITQMDKLIEAGGFDELQSKVREVLKENEASRNFVDGEDIVIEAEKITFKKNPTGNIDITGFNHKVVPYNEALNPGTDEIKLTNKNRVQFTTSFTKSNVAELKMYAMLGMDYAELVQGKNTETNSWIVSDNLLYYAFDANGKVEIIKDPILKYTFYPPVPSAP